MRTNLMTSSMQCDEFADKNKYNSGYITLTYVSL